MLNTEVGTPSPMSGKKKSVPISAQDGFSNVQGTLIVYFIKIGSTGA